MAIIFQIQIVNIPGARTLHAPQEKETKQELGFSILMEDAVGWLFVCVFVFHHLAIFVESM
jgi:hypothetical protein